MNSLRLTAFVCDYIRWRVAKYVYNFHRPIHECFFFFQNSQYWILRLFTVCQYVRVIIIGDVDRALLRVVNDHLCLYICRYQLWGPAEECRVQYLTSLSSYINNLIIIHVTERSTARPTSVSICECWYVRRGNQICWINYWIYIYFVHGSHICNSSPNIYWYFKHTKYCTSYHIFAQKVVPAPVSETQWFL